ncbi:MAG: hypothetical protein ABI333_12950 [bacterium]
MTVVGLFGPADDPEVEALAARLENRGATPWVVDLTDVPARTRVSFADDGVRLDGRPLQDMDAAYLRRVGTRLPDSLRYLGEAPNGPGWPALFESSVAALRAERAHIALRTAVVESLAAVRPVITPPGPQNLHRLKTHELDRLRAAGLPVPAFWAGSARESLERFAGAAAARWGGGVDKPLAGIYKTHLWTAVRAGAHPWGRRPALCQRYVAGDTIRCYVLAGRLLAAARIVHGGTVDSSMSQTGIEVLELPPAGRRLAEQAAEALGLAFCGLDLQRDRHGELFVIDCNVSPMFVNFSKLSRCDIAAHLAAHLIVLASERRPVPRPDVVDLVAGAKALLAGDPEIARRLPRPKRGAPAVRVGILGRRRDEHVGALAEALERAGAAPVVIDFHPFPRHQLASLGAGASFDDLRRPGTVELDELDLAHLRTTCFADLDPSGELPAQAAEVGLYYRRELAKVAFQLALAERLALRIPVCNPAASFRHHRQKAAQHQLLRRHALATPSAVVTSDPVRARAFVDGLGGRAVAKPLASGAEVVLADEPFFEDWVRRQGRRPYLFQQLVKGRSLRAYLLGGRLASMAELHYDPRHVDWRERIQGVTLTTPPAELEEQMARAVRLLELTYCGLDLEWDEQTQRFYLLDLNPSALFLGYSRLAGVDLAGRIAEYLVDVARGGAAWRD